MLICKLISVIRGGRRVRNTRGINSSDRGRVNRTARKISHFRAIAEIRAGRSANSRPSGGTDSRIRDKDIIIQSTGRQNSSLSTQYDCIIAQWVTLSAHGRYICTADRWLSATIAGWTGECGVGRIGKSRPGEDISRKRGSWSTMINLRNKSETFVRDLQLKALYAILIVDRNLDCEVVLAHSCFEHSTWLFHRKEELQGTREEKEHFILEIDLPFTHGKNSFLC